MVDRLNINTRFEIGSVEIGDLVQLKIVEFFGSSDEYIPRIRTYNSLDDVRYKPISSSRLRQHKTLQRDNKCYGVVFEYHVYDYNDIIPSSSYQRSGWTKEEWFGLMSAQNPILKQPKCKRKNYIEAFNVLVDNAFCWMHAADIIRVLKRS